MNNLKVSDLIGFRLIRKKKEEKRRQQKIEWQNIGIKKREKKKKRKKRKRKRKKKKKRKKKIKMRYEKSWKGGVKQSFTIELS